MMMMMITAITAAAATTVLLRIISHRLTFCAWALVLLITSLMSVTV